ncbi:MAG: dienelactone hydrolase family protein [Planctomycetota bacterium]
MELIQRFVWSVVFSAMPFTAFVAAVAAEPETLPVLEKGARDFEEMWSGFDPRVEPLEIEVLKEWEQEGVLLRVIRFRIGVFKGKVARLAAVYGYPIEGRARTDSNRGDGSSGSSEPLKEAKMQLPGLVQIHGGGQFADYRACLANAKRGYATVSIAWAGRIMAPDYTATSKDVQAFWSRDDDVAAGSANSSVLLTTDWGAVDGYHAPSRNSGNVFPSAKAADWTIDEVESGRNSGWFLCALAARRALTFLEQQPEVDAERLGVYGHSMGGKLTVLASIDKRVKAAAPSCGGISDLYNKSELYQETLGDDQSLKRLNCPILFLSPSNDFHGRIGDLWSAVESMNSEKWLVMCSPHHNHQDTAPFECGTLLWFDQHLKRQFEFPESPVAKLNLDTTDGVASLDIRVDASRPVVSVDVFYTQQGFAGDESIVDAQHRFWHFARPEQNGETWSAKLPVFDTRRPVWAYANVNYALESAAKGVGYYYREYDADQFTISSLMERATSDQLQQHGIQASLKRETVVEDFSDGWEKHWFTYRPEQWARTTHKLNSPVWKAPIGSALVLEISADTRNTLVVVIDDFVTEVDLVDSGGKATESGAQLIRLRPNDFRDVSGEPMQSWSEAKRLTLTHQHTLRPQRGQAEAPKKFGGRWEGQPPVFHQLRWETGAEK